MYLLQCLKLKWAEWLHSHSRQTWCMCISTRAQGRKPSVDGVRNSLYPLNLLYFHILAQEWLWLCKHIEQKPFVHLSKTWMNIHHLWRERHVHRSINISLGTPLLSTRTPLLQSDGQSDSFRKSVLSISSFKWIEFSNALRHDVLILQLSVFSSQTGHCI